MSIDYKQQKFEEAKSLVERLREKREQTYNLISKQDNEWRLKIDKLRHELAAVEKQANMEMTKLRGEEARYQTDLQLAERRFTDAERELRKAQDEERRKNTANDNRPSSGRLAA